MLLFPANILRIIYFNLKWFPVMGLILWTSFLCFAAPLFINVKFFSAREMARKIILSWREREEGRGQTAAVAGKCQLTLLTTRATSGWWQDWSRTSTVSVSASSSQEVTMLLTLSFICLTTEDVGYLWLLHNSSYSSTKTSYVVVLLEVKEVKLYSNTVAVWTIFLIEFRTKWYFTWKP